MEILLFIVGYLIQNVAFLLLLRKIYKHKSVYGLAIDTQIILLASTISRCVWSFETRLVETTWAYIELISSTLLCLYLCYIVFKNRHTTIKQAWWPLRYYVTLPLTMVLAILFHPGSKRWSIQILVAFTMYSEAVALLPQLYLMRYMNTIETFTSHYVGLLVVSRAVRLLFWIQLFIQGEHFFGLLFADAFHSILSADYLYLWCKKLRKGGQLILNA